MSSLRTTLVALVTLAIAAFPLAGASARGVSSELAHVTAQADCDNHAQMDHQSKTDDGQGYCSGDCGNCLCLGLMAVLTTNPGTLSAPMPMVKTARTADSGLSLAYIPPSPPPRI